MTRRSRDITGALPRRALMRGVGAGSVAAYLAGAAVGAVAAGEGPFPPHPRWKFVFVNHVTSNPFFVP
jgi:simple sugar transport system substrate-binding protein